MLNSALYKREMKGSLKILLIFAAILSMYVSIIIRMYTPEMVATLDGFVELLPEVMASVGMSAGSTSLITFLISYLYGFILLLFPMLFCILRGNGIIARYVDRGSMVTLLAAPVERRTVAITQMSVLISGILLLIAYTTGLEIAIAQTMYPGEFVISDLLKLNLALLCLHLLIGGICFLASCIFSDTRYSIAFGAGIPALMYVLHMLANVGEKTKVIQYFTFFTLFDPYGIMANQSGTVMGTLALFVGAVVLYVTGIAVFCRKDLHI